MTRKHISISVRGRVQGVSYRVSDAGKAKDFGVCGFVRNQEDGTVYIEAEGNEDELERLVKWCHSGPPRAEVTSCEVADGVLKNFSEFKILR